MRVLEFSSHEKSFKEAVREAEKSSCARRKCGSVIADQNGEIIGRGHNSPPGGGPARCHVEKSSYHEKVTDKTCCVHAEQRAVADALSRNPEKMKKSMIFFASVDESGEPLPAGKPYCTICSKTALDVGIKEFVLWEERGLVGYETGEYDELSRSFR